MGYISDIYYRYISPIYITPTLSLIILMGWPFHQGISRRFCPPQSTSIIQCRLIFFQDICEPSSCIHHLLPPPRDTSVLSWLRSATPLPRLTSRTKKHCSFITYALNHYQTKVSICVNCSPFYIYLFDCHWSQVWNYNNIIVIAIVIFLDTCRIGIIQL